MAKPPQVYPRRLRVLVYAAVALAASTLALLVRGWFAVDTFSHYQFDLAGADRIVTHWGVTNGDGRVVWWWRRQVLRNARIPADGPFSYTAWDRDPAVAAFTARPPANLFEKLAVGWENRDYVDGSGVRSASVSEWLVLVSSVLLLIPAARPWRAQRRTIRRQMSGQCVHCGYDLRGSSARCPECGEPLAPTPESKITGTAP